MKKIIILFLISIVTVSFAQTKKKYKEGSILVKFKESKEEILDLSGRLKKGLNNEKMERVFKKFEIKKGKKVFKNFDRNSYMMKKRKDKNYKNLGNWYKFSTKKTTDIQKLAKTLIKLDDIEYAHPDYIFNIDNAANDPKYTDGSQWGLKNTTNPESDINIEDAWQYNKGRSDVKVAILDYGVHYTNDDLDPGDRSRIINGYDFINNDTNPLPDDDATHGTKVTSVIAAITNNSRRVAGIMWNAKIIPLKVGTKSAGIILSAAAEGVEWAVNNGVNIINMSFSTKIIENNKYDVDLLSQVLYNAYSDNVLLVASMGNAFNNEAEIQDKYPAKLPWVMAVGATNEDNKRVKFENTQSEPDPWASIGGNHISVSSPGIHYTTNKDASSETIEFAGTSCSTPMVSGLGGLVISEVKDLGLNFTNDDIKHLIEVTSDHPVNNQIWDKYYGYGRIDAGNALRVLNTHSSISDHTESGFTSTKVASDIEYFIGSTMYFADVYKLTKTIDLSIYNDPYAWPRERFSNLGTDNSSYEGFHNWQYYELDGNYLSIETYVYFLKHDLAGYPVNEYWPIEPENVSVNYRVISKPFPLTNSIAGPTNLNMDEQGTFTCSAVGGKLPYNYQWEIKKIDDIIIKAAPSNQWIDVGYNNYQYTKPVPNNGDFRDFQIRCTVTDGNNNEVTSNILYVSYNGASFRLSKNNSEKNYDSITPTEYKVDNYPNPFNPSSIIRYQIPEAGCVNIKVFNSLGMEVKELVNEFKSPGIYKIDFNGTNMASGTYFYTIKINDFINTGKMLLVK